MNVRERPPQPAPLHKKRPQPYPAEKARGGEIILKKPWERAVFIGGLVALFVLILLLALNTMR